MLRQKLLKKNTICCYILFFCATTLSIILDLLTILMIIISIIIHLFNVNLNQILNPFFSLLKAQKIV